MEMLEKLESYSSNRLKDLQEIRSKGIKIVGYTPNVYVPEELIYASGAVPVPLNRGGEVEPLIAAAPYLGRCIDPFCRAQLGYKIMRDPIYQMVDLLVVPVGDLHIRGIADSWEFFTDTQVFRLGVPHVKKEHGFQHYFEGLNLLKEQLEILTGTKVDSEGLIREIYLSNRLNSVLKNISLLRMSNYPPITGKDFIRLIHNCLYIERNILLDSLKSIWEALRKKSSFDHTGPRILLTGSTLALGDYKVIDLLEDAGASIVIEEFPEGLLNYWRNIDMNDNPLQAIAQSYFTKSVPPAFFRGSAKERFEFLLHLATDFKVNGIVWYSLIYRDTYGIEAHIFRRLLEEKKYLC